MLVVLPSELALALTVGDELFCSEVGLELPSELLPLLSVLCLSGSDSAVVSSVPLADAEVDDACGDFVGVTAWGLEGKLVAGPASAVNVGGAEGDAVGSVVGEAEGLAEGEPVGDSEGVSVGPIVGGAIGAVVGLSVGDCVGAFVGEWVGAAVGDPVGAAVGDPVGDTVGADSKLVSSPLFPGVSIRLQSVRKRAHGAKKVSQPHRTMHHAAV